MKYCTKCGNELYDEAVICPKCGCPVQNASISTDKPSGGLKTAAKIFMVITCCSYGLSVIISSILSFFLFANSSYAFATIIPLFWCIPMTVSYFKKTKNSLPVSTGFKVCTLLFVNLLSGIFMLCDKE